MQRADRAAQILAAESDGCTSAAETGTDTTTRHRRINPLHFTSRKTPTRSPSTIHPGREKGSKCSGPIERRKFWRQRAMAARVRLKLARIQPHVTGASIHFILQAARPLLDLPPRFTLGAAASLTRPRASWIEWRGHAERHGDEGEGGTGRLRQRWSLRQYTRLPHSAIGEARVLGVRYQLSALLSVVKRRC